MKNRTAVLVSLLSALLGVLLIFSYINNIEQETALNFDMQNVIVAKQYIPKYSVITLNMVKVEQIPVKYIQPQCIMNTKELLDENDNAQFITIAPVMEGETILKTKLILPGKETGLSVVIAKGKRAIAIPVKDDLSSSSLIKPGDKIDLIATSKDKSEFLLQNLKILSVGDTVLGAIRTQDGNDPLLSEMTSAVQGEERIISLEVDPAEALKISLAKDLYDFNIVLRNIVDESNVRTLPAVPGNLFGLNIKANDKNRIIHGPVETE